MAKVYVGNLSWGTTDDSLRAAFEQYGQVTDSIILKDRMTGRSRGFGFVTFSTAEEAEQAVNGMNEQDLDGRNIRCNIATDRPPRAEGEYRPRGGFRGRGRGGFGRGGFRNNYQNDDGYGNQFQQQGEY